MRDVEDLQKKGCWVCGEKHAARSSHSKKKADKSLERLTEDGAYVLTERAAKSFQINKDRLALDEETSESSRSDEGESLAVHVTTSKDISGSVAASVFDVAFAHKCFGFPSSDLEFLGSSAASKDQNHFCPTVSIVNVAKY